MEERKRRVLNAIIKDYIANAEPVGSRAVAKKYGLGVSPATIRNEMSDLTEDGYIEQPHTSAGRIPSGKGYRFFVDHLMEREHLTTDQVREVREVLAGELGEMDSFMRSLTGMISRLTNYTAIAALPERGNGRVANIQLVQVNDYQVLVVLLASTGIIRHKLIDMPRPLAPAYLGRLEDLLRRRLVGQEIKLISHELLKELLLELQLQQEAAEQALDLLEHSLLPEEHNRIFTSGVMHMLSQPEFRDIDKLKGLFSLLEEDTKVRELLDSADAGQKMLTVTIGGEMPVEGAKDCSMVVANYFVNGEKAGSLGVLGPTRMSYGRTVSLMEFIAAELSKAMSDKQK